MSNKISKAIQDDSHLLVIARAVARVDQQKLGSIFHVSKSYISRMESGERKVPERILEWAEMQVLLLKRY